MSDQKSLLPSELVPPVPDGRAMIHPAIIAIMRAIEPIAKSSRNQQQNFDYRGVDAVYNAIHPHFAEHGVYSTSKVINAEHRAGKSEKGKDYVHAILHMRFTYWAADGSSVETEVVGEGVDYSGDKASNKAMSIADKYALLQLLKIPTAAVDPDRHDNPDQRADAPKAQPRAQRVTEAQLKAMQDEWRSFTTEPPIKEAFLKFCRAACGEFDAGSLSAWTQDRLRACRKAMGLEEPT